MKKTRPNAARKDVVAFSDLEDHPEQRKYFRPHGPNEYAALKADIAKHGVKEPPQVLPKVRPDGSNYYQLITGHTRAGIWRELGHAEIAVKVRYDLTEALPAEILREFLSDNVARRHLDPLDQARAEVGIYVAEKELAGRRLLGNPLDNPKLRERIRRNLRMSTKNAGRYMSILRAPHEVQNAFQRQEIGLVAAARVIRLPSADQACLSARLRAGEDAAKVIADYFRPATKRHVKTNDAVAAFARSLRKAVDDLGDRIDQVTTWSVRKHLETLRAGQSLLQHLIGINSQKRGKSPVDDDDGNN